MRFVGGAPPGLRLGVPTPTRESETQAHCWCSDERFDEADELDLRRPEDAHRVERALAGVDPAKLADALVKKG